jgi:hypothetical protein
MTFSVSDEARKDINRGASTPEAIVCGPSALHGFKFMNRLPFGTWAASSINLRDQASTGLASGCN